MKTPQTKTLAAVDQPRLVRHSGGRWLYAFDPGNEDWSGCCKTLEEAIDEAARHAELDFYPPGTTAYFAHGRKATKAECEEYGVDSPWYQIDSRDAIAITLPNVQGQPRAGKT